MPYDPPVPMPTPMALLEQLRMFARCAGLFIHAVITTAGETGSLLRPWADTVATLEVMDRVRAEVGIDFAPAVAAREGRDRG